VTAEAHEAQGRAGGERARWRVMYGYVRPHRLALLTGGLLSLLTAATGLALPLVVRALIDDLGHHRSVTELLLLMTLQSDLLQRSQSAVLCREQVCANVEILPSFGIAGDPP